MSGNITKDVIIDGSELANINSERVPPILIAIAPIANFNTVSNSINRLKDMILSSPNKKALYIGERNEKRSVIAKYATVFSGIEATDDIGCLKKKKSKEEIVPIIPNDISDSHLYFCRLLLSFFATNFVKSVCMDVAGICTI